MKILYFSGTGNSLYVAKLLGEEIIPIKQYHTDPQPIFEDDVIGIIFPVYWISVPVYVRQFLEKSTFHCDYLFGIMTYGDHHYGASELLFEVKTANGRTFDYINYVKMVENYLPMYEMNREIKKAQSYYTEATIVTIRTEIADRKIYRPKASRFSQTLSKKMNQKHCQAIRENEGEARNLKITNGCISCGICVQICPMHNISMNYRNVYIGMNCADCLACIQNCPKGAIHTAKEKSKARYRNPNISLQELL